jgi:hypothetical protein
VDGGGHRGPGEQEAIHRCCAAITSTADLRLRCGPPASEVGGIGWVRRERGHDTGEGSWARRSGYMEEVPFLVCTLALTVSDKLIITLTL